jgi:hypothetical protein
LRSELSKGRLELNVLENKKNTLYETILRISGAIQVLEELLSEVNSIDTMELENRQKNVVDISSCSSTPNCS